MAQQYVEAGRVVGAVVTEGKSLRAALYGGLASASPAAPSPAAAGQLSHASGSAPALAKLNLLASETLKYKDVLHHVLTASRVIKASDWAWPVPQLLVMAYDLLISAHHSIEGAGKLKKRLMESKTSLHAELSRLKVKRRVAAVEDLLPAALRPQAQVTIPRYVRVNLLLSSVAQAIAHFRSEGWTEIDFATAEPILRSAHAHDKTHWRKEFWRDPAALPDGDLLAFPPRTDFHAHPLLLQGHIVLQDKASALSGAALEPESSDLTYCIDACAAPGQKTAQLAQAMRNRGHLFAFDQDARRLEVLKRLSKRNGLRSTRALQPGTSRQTAMLPSSPSPLLCVELVGNLTHLLLNLDMTPVCGSFLDVNPKAEPYRRVQYILLDPSCSGSGLIKRLDFAPAPDSINDEGSESELAVEDEADSRLDALQEFQIQALRHALSFPNVRRVVYSTCSVHDKENEEVVEKVLAEFPTFRLKKLYPDFRGRGKPLYPHGELCVRTDPVEDRTIGFFVACFEQNAQASVAASPQAPNETQAKKTKRRKKRKRKSCDGRAEPHEGLPGEPELTQPSKRPKLGIEHPDMKSIQ